MELLHIKAWAVLTFFAEEAVTLEGASLEL